MSAEPYLDIPAALQARLAGWPLELVTERLSSHHHGDFAKWADALQRLSRGAPATWRARDAIEIDPVDSKGGAKDGLKADLMTLHPWRKGPFRIGPHHIDTEWRSNWKWQRLADHVNWHDQHVLDIGSGNGYFGWQMLAAGARSVIGIDPTILFCMQHLAIQKFLQHPDHWVLPLGIEEIPTSVDFNAVLSMGVIYHRRDPQEHVRKLHALTEPGGQCVIESLVVQAEQGFKPKQRYARMRNVWWIPSPNEITDWMHAAGFNGVKMIDCTPTSVQEQRTTPWMTFESLPQALDPEAPHLTVEGYPAPVRAIFLGQKAAD